jgi:hypothetical protein
VSVRTSSPRKRRRPQPPPRAWSERIYVEVPREEIWYLKFILEAYDHLAYCSVIDKYKAVLEIVYSCDGERDVHDLLEGLAEEIPLKQLPVRWDEHASPME